MALQQQRAEPSPKGFNISSAPEDDGDDRRKAGRTGGGQGGKAEGTGRGDRGSRKKLLDDGTRLPHEPWPGESVEWQRRKIILAE